MPPIRGPVVSPTPTTAPEMPIALPLSPGGNSAAIRAFRFDSTIDEPTPCITRKAISCQMLPEAEHRSMPTVETR